MHNNYLNALTFTNEKRFKNAKECFSNVNVLIIKRIHLHLDRLDAIISDS